jgi:hypothetical protein
MGKAPIPGQEDGNPTNPNQKAAQENDKSTKQNPSRNTNEPEKRQPPMRGIEPRSNPSDNRGN